MRQLRFFVQSYRPSRRRGALRERPLRLHGLGERGRDAPSLVLDVRGRDRDAASLLLGRLVDGVVREDLARARRLGENARDGGREGRLAVAARQDKGRGSANVGGKGGGGGKSALDVADGTARIVERVSLVSVEYRGGRQDSRDAPDVHVRLGAGELAARLGGVATDRADCGNSSISSVQF